MEVFTTSMSIRPEYSNRFHSARHTSYRLRGRLMQTVLRTGLAAFIIGVVLRNATPAADWPFEASQSHVQLTFRNSAFEPSGMAVLGSWLYVVSDDGRIGRVALNDSAAPFQVQNLERDWSGKDKDLQKAENDFESIAVVPGDPHLYLGIEGDGKDLEHPKILRYLPPGDTVDLGRYSVKEALGTRTRHVAWELNDPHRKGSRDEEVQAGMEAMTFLPDGSHPFPVTSGNRAFAGVFLVSSQNQKGLAFAYDLKQNGDVEVVGTLAAPLHRAALSDLLFVPHSGTAFALYDEGAELLQELTVSREGFLERRRLNVQYRAPGTMAGVEALAIAPSGDLFLALDQSTHQAAANGNCLGQSEIKNNGEPRCDRQGWSNFVYRYEKLLVPTRGASR